MTQKRDLRKSARTAGRPRPLTTDVPSDAAGSADNKEHSERLLTLTEAAYQLGRVHRTTIMRWVKEGKLRCVRLSRKAILFEPGELERFIREHRSTI